MKTRLTKVMREQFVEAVMKDVPQMDYREECEKELRQAVRSFLPDVVLAVLDSEHAAYLFHSSIYLWQVGDRCVYANMITVPGERLTGWVDQRIKIIERHRDMRDAQTETRDKIRHDVTTMIASYRTLEDAREGLPEFEKYLPSAPEKAAPLPTILTANVVSELMRAGWPK